MSIALRLALGFAFIGLVRWSIVSGLRSGKRIERNKQPVLYWISATVGFAVIIMLIAILARIIIQVA
jgi:hypothetical protein